MLKLLEVKMTRCFLRKMLMFGVKYPVILFEVSACFILKQESGWNFLFLPLEFLLNETDYSWHCAIKTGEKVSRCDTIVFCFMNNVSWRKEWLSIWIP